MAIANPLRLFVEHRDLIWSLTVNSVFSRYRHSYLGMLWPVAQPLLLIGVFAFVFGSVMPLKWVADSTSGIPFALFLYAGLVVFSFFSEAVNRSPGLLLERPNLIKKVVFPLEILAIVSVASSLIFYFINFLIFTLVLALFGEFPLTGWLMAWVFVAPLVLFLIGISWFLSAITVYVRDVAHIVGIVVSALMFFTPVFFPLSSAPERLQWLLSLNPVSVAIEGIRAEMLSGPMPSALSVSVQWGASILVFIFGWMWFKRLREGFADVL